jgi:3-hydroxyacyl-CoA dehydrogenase
MMHGLGAGLSAVVTYLVREGVAIIEIDNPPMNALSPQIRRDLDAALARAETADDVGAVVLRGRGKSFGSGTDPAASLAVRNAPGLGAICARIDAFAKPVIAALHGTIMGNSSDLAVAAHYRVAQNGTAIGFPEVRLGLLPAGGASQRLPRLVGAEVAIAMLRTGRPVGIASGSRNGLADRIVQDKCGVAAFALALELIAAGSGPRPAQSRTGRVADPATWLDAVGAARANVAKDALAVVSEIVNCVEAALLLPYDEGLAFDEAAAEGLRLSDTSAALCHMARAERRALALPAALGAEPREIQCVGICLRDDSAAALAVACLDAGFAVVLSADEERGLEECFARIGEVYDARISGRTLTEDDVDDRMDRLTMLCGNQSFGSAQMILDAASTDTAEAARRWAAIDAAAPAGAVFGVVAPGLALDTVAKATQRPGDIVGFHVLGAAAAEIVTLPKVSRHAVATAFEFARRLGRLPVRSIDASGRGGIGVRLLVALEAAADSLVSQGLDPDEIDAALTGWGLSEGVFEGRARRGDAVDGDETTLGALAAIGAGGAVFSSKAQSRGSRPMRLSPETIQRTCLAAVVNEGARLLTEGVARMPSDIDALAVHGLGYARRTGGPMQAGDLAGLLGLRRALPRLGEAGGIGGQPSPLLDDLIKNGRGFDSLNSG